MRKLLYVLPFRVASRCAITGAAVMEWYLRREHPEGVNLARPLPAGGSMTLTVPGQNPEMN